MPVVTTFADPQRKRCGTCNSSVTDNFKFECNRLLSFQCWSSNCRVRPFVLAFFGFFCISPRETQCFACHQRVSDWKPGDDPFRRHVHISPKCSFLLRPRENNVPLKLEDRSSILKKLNDSSGGISEKFKLEKNRLLSFGNFSVYNPKNFSVWYGLAADGFFGTNSDTVECFACHGQVSLNLQIKAVEIHDLLFKHCPLPSATPCGNRPIAFSQLKKLKQYFKQSRSFGEMEILRNDEYRCNLVVMTEREFFCNGEEKH
ncbi:Baculoviral IAP repeat-containing protein 7-A [Holothuria leucospilota]|uniref:Baculoviral IAP repeat-containing protein 7-A n=1 Tax=Holothuria leucospilota TaxID=206669 RepID=A0A9Q1BHE1_HOLLE|nr:Baculoviral IAP repeat-containing protein 7-A [Holothuria leucospilota]